MDWTANSTTEFSSRVRAIVNQLYHPSFRSQTGVLPVHPRGHGSLVHPHGHGSSVYPRGHAPPALGAALAASWEWVLEIKADGYDRHSSLLRQKHN